MSEKILAGAAARRERSRHEMRATILAEARRIVTGDGLDRLSMRAIARALGYSPGALYEYYRDKEAVLHGLYFEGAGGLGEWMDRRRKALPPDTEPVVVLAELGRAYRAYALDHAELYRLIFATLPQPPPPSPVDPPDQNRGGFGVLMKAVQHGMDAGVLVDAPAPALAVACWAGVHGFVSLELSCHLVGGDGPAIPPPSAAEGRRQRDTLFEHLLHSLFHGIVREDSHTTPAADPPRESARAGALAG